MGLQRRGSVLGRNGNARFAHWLQNARRRAKITQEDLAEAMGVTQSAIYDWEHRGMEKMAPADINKLAKTFEIDPTEVAAALGYPVRPRQTAMMPMTRDVWFERVSDLNSRLEAAQVETVRQWAEDVMPGEDRLGRTPRGTG